MARHFGMLRENIEKCDGQFVKSLGDGTMSSFYEPAEALRAAQQILNVTGRSNGPAIALCIGIYTGQVAQTTDDFFGSVVNKAARITVRASPGEIQVSDATRNMVGERQDFRFVKRTAVKLEGFEGEHVIHRLEY